MKSRNSLAGQWLSTHCQGVWGSVLLGTEESTSQQPGKQTNERQRNDDSWSQDDGYLGLEEGSDGGEEGYQWVSNQLL